MATFESGSSAPALAAVDRGLGRVEVLLDLVAGLFIFGLVGLVSILGWDAGAGMIGTIPHSKSVTHTLSVLPTIVCDKVGGLHLALAVLAGVAYQARTGKLYAIVAEVMPSRTSADRPAPTLGEHTAELTKKS